MRARLPRHCCQGRLQSRPPAPRGALRFPCDALQAPAAPRRKPGATDASWRPPRPATRAARREPHATRGWETRAPSLPAPLARKKKRYELRCARRPLRRAFSPSKRASLLPQCHLRGRSPLLLPLPPPAGAEAYAPPLARARAGPRPSRPRRACGGRSPRPARWRWRRSRAPGRRTRRGAWRAAAAGQAARGALALAPGRFEQLTECESQSPPRRIDRVFCGAGTLIFYYFHFSRSFGCGGSGVCPKPKICTQPLAPHK